MKYKAVVECFNCGLTAEVEIRVGTPVQNEICSYCGCTTLLPKNKNNKPQNITLKFPRQII